MAGSDVNIVIGAQDKASPIFARVAANVGSLGGILTSLGPAAVAAGAAVAGAAAGFFALSSAVEGIALASQRIDQLHDQAIGLGDSVGNIQAFQFAMQEAGNVSAERSIDALRKMQRAIGEIAGGDNKAGAELFAKLGLDANKLSLQGPVEQFLQVKAAVGGIANAAERAAAAQKLLGRSAGELIPALVVNQESFEASLEAAKALGATVSGPGAEGIAQMNDSLGRVQTGFQGIWNQVAVAFAPAVDAVASSIASWLPPIVEFAQTHLPFAVDVLARMAGYAYDVVTAISKAAAWDFAGAAEAMSANTQEKFAATVQANREKYAAEAIKREEAAKAAQLAAQQAKEIELAEKKAAEEERLRAESEEKERAKIERLAMEEEKRLQKIAAMQERDAEQARREEEQRLAAEARAPTSIQATQSRLLTRGAASNPMDKVEKATQESAKRLASIDESLKREENKPTLQLVQIA
jgi:hypothetical protein